MFGYEVVDGGALYEAGTAAAGNGGKGRLVKLTRLIDDTETAASIAVFYVIQKAVYFGGFELGKGDRPGSKPEFFFIFNEQHDSCYRNDNSGCDVQRPAFYDGEIHRLNISGNPVIG